MHWQSFAVIRTQYIHSDIVTGAHLLQRLCKCICIILDLVFIFHSLLYDYSPFLPMCIDNKFPLPDWFQRYGAVQTLSVLRLCRESLWRQVCLDQLFSCCWVVGDREKGSFCVPLSKKLPASFFQFSLSLHGPISCQCLLRHSPKSSRFSFGTRRVYRRREIRLLCLLEHYSTFRSVVGLFLLRFNVTSPILCGNWLRYSKNCEACMLTDNSLGEIRTQDSWNEVTLEHLQWLPSGEEREIPLKHHKAYGVSLKHRTL